MIKEGHLQCYTLKLTARSPLFIGSGRKYQKTEYVFNSDTKQVSFLDEASFFQLMAEKNLVDRYEQFIFSGKRDLYDFFKNNCQLSATEMERITRYKVNSSNALDKDHSLKEIWAFQRNSAGQAYLPGSSVKGALRTALLTELLGKTQPQRKTDKELNSLKDIPEGKYFHTLKCRTDDKGNPLDDPVNSLMRGIHVSDSQPISDTSMILSGKLDVNVAGVGKKLNVCRECVAPGTEFQLILALDQSILQGKITANSLLNTINAFGDYYWNTYVSCFDKTALDVNEGYYNCLILGGGAGFFSKTAIYPYLGDQALHWVSQTLSKQFRNHYHHNDESLGISPHTLKYTEYNGQHYPFGVCGVELL